MKTFYYIFKAIFCPGFYANINCPVDSDTYFGFHGILCGILCFEQVIICVRTYNTYTHIHTYIHIHTHTHTYTNTYTHIHTYVHAHTHTYTHTHTHIHIHTHTCMYTSTRTSTNTHTCTHSYVHVHTHTRTSTSPNTHRHKQIYTHVYVHEHIHTYKFAGYITFLVQFYFRRRQPFLIMSRTSYLVVWVMFLQFVSPRSLIDPFYSIGNDLNPDEEWTISAKPLTVHSKRAPWAPSEIRLDEFVQKLRSRKLQGRDVMLQDEDDASLFEPDERFPEGADDKGLTDSANAVYKILKFVEAYRECPRCFQADSKQDGDNDASREYNNKFWQYNSPQNVGMFGMKEPVSKRRLGDIRSPSEIHPVYLGFGQQAANAALSTFASLVAEEEKRLQESDQLPSNPVRFIGKRND